MAKIYYEDYGDPLEVLKIGDWSPADANDGEVQVQWKSSAIIPADLATIRGLYRNRQVVPAVPGYDGCGIVTGVGTGSEFKVGQKVLIPPKRSKPSRNGTWQSGATYAASELLAVPDQYNIDFDNLAHFFTTPLTTWVMLMEEAKVSASDWVLVTAAGSSLGRVAIQMSKIFGFKVIGVVRRSEQKKEILELGAAEAIGTDSEDLVQRVKAITKLKGAQVVIDAIGGEIGAQCFRALSDRGRMIVYGLLAQERYSPVDIKMMLFNCIQMSGFWMPDWWYKTDPLLKMKICHNVFSWMNKGMISCPVHEKFKFEQFKRALTVAGEPGLKGRIILTDSV